jgi:hypothetical protein
MNVWWREGSVRPVNTEEELLAAVAEAEAEAEVPFIVTVEAPAGTLTLVVSDLQAQASCTSPPDYNEAK